VNVVSFNIDHSIFNPIKRINPIKRMKINDLLIVLTLIIPCLSLKLNYILLKKNCFYNYAALAKIVFKINVMSVSASYGSFEHHVRNARNLI